MTGQLTVTAKTGPANTVTALLVQSLQELTFDFVEGMLRVRRTGSPTFEEFDINASTTVTATVSAAGGLYSFTVS